MLQGRERVDEAAIERAKVGVDEVCLRGGRCAPRHATRKRRDPRA